MLSTTTESLITTRTKKIARSWYDQSSGYIYYVDCEYDRTTSYVWYLDLSDDSINEVENILTTDIYDIFMIGTDVFMIYFSFAFEILTTLIRPDGDSARNEWTSEGGGLHHDDVDEVVTQPSAGDGVELYTSVDDAFEQFNFEDINLSVYESGKVTAVTVWSYVQTPNSGTLSANWDALGSRQVTVTGSYAWTSNTWSGLDLEDSDINGHILTYVKGEVPLGRQVRLDTCYAVITFEGDFAANLYVKNITQATEVVQSMGATVDRSYDMGQVVVVDNDDAYFLWKWNDEDAELWKYDKTGVSITQKLSTQTDFGSDTNIPPIIRRAISYDGSNFFYFIIGDGKEEISTIVAQAGSTFTSTGAGDYLNFDGIDENGDPIDYYLWFNVSSGNSDPAPSSRIGLECAIGSGDTAQQVSDAIQDIINNSRYFAAGNAAGTSTTVTMQNISNGSVTDIVDVDTGLSVAVSTQGTDNTYYLYSYDVSADLFIKLAELNIALMLDRNVVGSAAPFLLEKGYHITEDKIYQIPLRFLGRLNVISTFDFTNPIISVTDHFVIDSGGKIYLLSDIRSEITGCEIEYLVSTPIIANITTDLLFGFSQFIPLYEGTTLIFEGYIKKKIINGGIRSYDLISPNKEMINNRFSKSYTSQTAKYIMEDLLDTFSLYLAYETGTISSNFTATYTLDINNKTFQEIFDTLMDFEDGSWWATPSGIIYAYKIVDIPSTGDTVYKRTTASSNHIKSIPKFSQLSQTINKVHLYGGIVGGVRLESFADDETSQLANGITEIVDHFPHIHDQTQLDTLATAILNRTGITSNPIYITVLLALTFRQYGKYLNLEFDGYDELATPANYYILGLVYFPLEQEGEYTLSSGLVQEGREYDINIQKTSNADEEQIDILGADVLSMINKIVFPTKWGGLGGFSSVIDYWQVAHSDTSADIWLTFFVPETRTDWKILFITFSNVSARTDSGTLSAGKAASGELNSTNNIFNAVNFDLAHATASYWYVNKSSVFSATKEDIIRANWHKDDNPGSGTLFIHGVILWHE